MPTALDAQTNLIVFDDGLPSLSPLTDLRSAFDVRTGAFTTLERIFETVGRAKADALAVPKGIADLTREAHPGTPINEIPDGDSLLVSARFVLPDGLDVLEQSSAITDATSGHLLAMRAEKAHIESFLASNTIPSNITKKSIENARVIEHPWDVIRHRDACLAFDLAQLSATIPSSKPIEGVTMLEPTNCFIHPSATALPSASLDATKGPIVIDEGATVRLGAVIIGPVYIGKNSTVLDCALIKANTAIGPVCKVAGEVGGTIIQSHSNKAHDGHIGDSWIGQWVNLGAGTTNSNLLNTYSPVTATSEGTRHHTGLTFLGTIAGDHVKTAICTRIMTGTTLGTGAMIASSAPPPAYTPNFAWLTDEHAHTYRTEKFIDVMTIAMARRDTTPTDAYIARIRELASNAS